MSKQIWRLLEIGEVIKADDDYEISHNIWVKVLSHEVASAVTIGNYPIRRRETIPDAQWPEPIKVSERLPTESDGPMVLAFDKFNQHGQCWQLADWNAYGFGWEKDGFTHWLSIPTAPPPEKSEAEKAWESRCGNVIRPHELRTEFIAGFETARKGK